MYSFTATGSSMSHVTLSSAWPLSLTPCPLTGHPHIWCWLLLGSLWQMWTLSSPRSPAAWVAGPVCWCLVPAGPGWPDITHHRWDTETQGPQISAYVHKYSDLSVSSLSCKWGLEPTGFSDSTKISNLLPSLSTDSFLFAMNIWIYPGLLKSC